MLRQLGRGTGGEFLGSPSKPVSGLAPVPMGVLPMPSGFGCQGCQHIWEHCHIVPAEPYLQCDCADVLRGC